MSWIEQDMSTLTKSKVTGERQAELESAKEEGMDVVLKEADSGLKPIQAIDFQPIKSPGNYEAEFAKKDEDIIFHFWPWGYHQADNAGRTAPRFRKDFEDKLREAMTKEFLPARLSIESDADVGAFFVKAQGYGEMFFRDLAISACQRLHYAMGGE